MTWISAIAPSAVLPRRCVTSVGAALLDGDFLQAVADGPVDGRARQRDVKRHAVVARGERLEVGADLVADIALRRGAVGADDAEIDQAVLHEMAARVVDDDGVRHAVLVEFPRGERRALVARPRFVDPDVDRQARRRAP